MNSKITVVYSPQIVTTASRRFFLRMVGSSGVLYLILLWVVCVGLLGMGNREWYTIALATIACLLTLVLIASYVTYQRRSFTNYQRFDSREVLFDFNQSELTVKSSVGESTIQWKAFQKLWKFPEVWLLFASTNQYITLPIDQIPKDLQLEIESQVRANGGMVN